MGVLNGIFSWRKGKGLALKIQLNLPFTQAIQQPVSEFTKGSYFHPD